MQHLSFSSEPQCRQAAVTAGYHIYGMLSEISCNFEINIINGRESNSGDR